MDTDGHGFYRADVIFEHESHEFHESHSNIFGTRMDADGHGFYHAEGIFEHELHELHEYFLAHGWTRMDTDFTVRRITLFILPQIAQMDTDFYHADGGF